MDTRTCITPMVIPTTPTMYKFCSSQDCNTPKQPWKEDTSQIGNNSYASCDTTEWLGVARGWEATVHKGNAFEQKGYHTAWKQAERPGQCTKPAELQSSNHSLEGDTSLIATYCKKLGLCWPRTKVLLALAVSSPTENKCRLTEQAHQAFRASMHGIKRWCAGFGKNTHWCSFCRIFLSQCCSNYFFWKRLFEQWSAGTENALTALYQCLGVSDRPHFEPSKSGLQQLSGTQSSLGHAPILYQSV